MASTEDMAPSRTETAAETTTPRRASGRPRGSTAAAGRRRRSAAAATEPQLEEQIAQLQDDVRSIAKSLMRMGNNKVQEGQGIARAEYRNLMQQGQAFVGEVTDEFESVERQIKDTIRARPLTAVASAIGIGFLLAILTR